MIRLPPEIEVSLGDLPSDPTERHEALVDILGQYVMWMREWSIKTTRELCESEISREKIRAANREKWNRLAQLPAEDRAIACDVARATTDRFVQMFLVMLGNQGIDQRIGPDHCVRFRLDLEICDIESGEVIESTTINRGGQKFFGDYWGRWINQTWRKP